MSIELPKDAEGREIPLDTTVLFDKDGKELCVKRVEFDPFGKEWSFAVRIDSVSRLVVYRRPCVVYLEKPAPPDSWKRLLEDLGRTVESGDEFSSPACAYTNHGGSTCGDCKYLNGRETCTNAMLADIASRIRKLRGDAE